MSIKDDTVNYLLTIRQSYFNAIKLKNYTNGP